MRESNPRALKRRKCHAERTYMNEFETSNMRQMEQAHNGAIPEFSSQ